MVLNFLIVIGGALVILGLAEIVMRQTLRLAAHFGLSGNFVGLTILSIGTSLVEIITHAVGSVRILWQPELMNPMSALLIGSNIGSDIFQQNVVLAIVGLIGTVVVVRRNLAIEIGALIAASLLLWAACLGGTVTRLEGMLLTLTYLAYLYVLWQREPNERPVMARVRLRATAIAGASLAVVLSFVCMALVADPLLAAATRLVALLPMSASLFGVVVLGVCTALPELMTALVSISKGQREISAGVLIGSNITNPLLSAGLGAMISGYTVPPVIVIYDLPVKIATGALLFVFLWRRSNLSRAEAVVLIAVYIGYLLARGTFFPHDS
jgi:cation:H+ antiporter